MKSIYILLFTLLFSAISFGQGKFLTKQGYTSFFSATPIEDIKAENNQVLSIIDTSTGTIAISILIKSFMFEKSLMQEHFNENYLESDKYPKAIFKGQILDFDSVNENENPVTIVGDITIHGVTKKIETKGIISKKEDNIILNGDFIVKVADFEIEIPSVVSNNIAESIKVTYELDHKPYKK
ncbi:YceI-like domain-containing protein [Aquimarina amphilecti]|uniref:YceI-like domain-containing protein n=1 Tax=Aquimarina amphilecti TaxID=1038014 RepID=A0A1H7HNC1_AQUAM|nr:YceI family protein [Aquimarina amphilecti]SEK50540.1 YceI-like domain-containing protein [Aquimarina amphilecti]